MTARLLVLQHEDECPPGLLGPWLETAGLELDVLPAHRGVPVPGALIAHDALLVLGGEMGALDDRVAPWLPAVRSLVAGTVGAGLPFLGICLGHQLAAVALGGSVAANPAGQAQGLTPWCPTPGGTRDPLLAGVAAGSPVVQWNGDVVTSLPPGAQALAHAPDGSVQAMRCGPLAWGLQPHPEADAAIFRSWTTDKPSAALPRPDGIDLEAVAAAIGRSGPALADAWQPLGQRFAAIVLAETARRSGLSSRAG